MKTKSTECEKKLPAMHRVPKYFALYKGRDGWHTPYNGKFAHFYISTMSYIETDFENEPAYVNGLTGILPKAFTWDEKSKDLLELAHDDPEAVSEEFEGDNT